MGGKYTFIFNSLILKKYIHRERKGQENNVHSILDTEVTRKVLLVFSYFNGFLWTMRV